MDTPNCARNWKRTFWGVELFVGAACLYGLALVLMWPYEVAQHPWVVVTFQFLITGLIPMIWAFLAAIVFLLFVSPFLLKRLRRTAIQAWLVAALGLASAVCIVALR